MEFRIGCKKHCPWHLRKQNQGGHAPPPLHLPVSASHKGMLDHPLKVIRPGVVFPAPHTWRQGVQRQRKESKMILPNFPPFITVKSCYLSSIPLSTEAHFFLKNTSTSYMNSLFHLVELPHTPTPLCGAGDWIRGFAQTRPLRLFQSSFPRLLLYFYSPPLGTSACLLLACLSFAI